MMTVDALEALLYRHDHLGLASMGAPEDEYRAEAETVFERLPSAESATDVQVILREEYVTWFGVEVAPEFEQFQAAAEEIWTQISVPD